MYNIDKVGPRQILEVCSNSTTPMTFSALLLAMHTNHLLAWEVEVSSFPSLGELRVIFV